MKLKIALFAVARDLMQASEIELEIVETSTVGDLKSELGRQYPQLSEIVSRSAISLDQAFANDDMIVDSNSELAIIPPVSGG